MMNLIQPKKQQSCLRFFYVLADVGSIYTPIIPPKRFKTGRRYAKAEATAGDPKEDDHCLAGHGARKSEQFLGPLAAK